MKRDETQMDKRLRNHLDRLRIEPGRDPQRAARGKAVFLKQAEALRKPVSPKPIRRHTGWINTIFPVFQRKEHFPVLNTLIAVVLALAVLFGGTGATVYAAQGSLPDQALYPVKTLSEDALLSLTASPQRQVDLILDFSDRRVSEMTGLHSAGKPVPQSVTDRLQNELDKTLELVAGMDDPAMLQALERVLLRAEAQLQNMTMLMTGSPENPEVTRAQVRLQEQVRLAALGEADPQGFRLQVRQRFQYRQGAPGGGQQGPGLPDETPVPPGNGYGPGPGGNQPTDSPGQGGNQPTGTPGQHGPGPQSPNRTPQPGSGSGHGP